MGVSFGYYDDYFIEQFQKFPNAVLHVINGIVDSKKDLRKLYNKNIKILILGYKQFRRGNDYYSASVEKLKSDMNELLPEILNRFKVVSFDNLAIKQLKIKKLLSEGQWNEFYQGDDGSHTMYVDLVNKKFAVNSTSDKTFDLLDSVDEMFDIVKGEKL